MSTLPTPYEPIEYDGPQGPFIVLEGVSGIGKSTLAALLARRLDGSRLHTLADPHTGWSDTANRQFNALPQFAFYLSGLLHVSDRIRACRPIGPVIADRYVSSVTACHAAAHGLDPADVAHLIDPFRPSLATPDHTFYLHCSAAVLRERLRSKTDTKQDDTDLFDVPGRLKQLTENFRQVADSDPTATVLNTDSMSPTELADAICTHMERTRA